MSAFTIPQEEFKLDVSSGSLSTYTFGSNVAKHHFCNKCGIYPFHETMRNPGHFRVNLGCLDNVDSINISFEVFDGASI